MGFAIITGHLGVVGSSVSKILKENTNLTIVGIDCDLWSKLFLEVEPLNQSKWSQREKEIGVDISHNIDKRDQKSVEDIFNKLISILEIINILKEDFGVKLKYTLEDNPRTGDHIWYITSNKKLKQKFDWEPKIKINAIIEDIIKTL